MKTEKTKEMERALIYDSLRKNEHIALEVPFAKTVDIGGGTYMPEDQWEFIDAVIEKSGFFTCLELKISMSDLHSKAAQSFHGHKNYLVCPNKLAIKIIKNNDSWLKEHKGVGIIAWDEDKKFKIVKRCKINYSIKDNDWKMLAKGVIVGQFEMIKKYSTQFL